MERENKKRTRSHEEEDDKNCGMHPNNHQKRQKQKQSDGLVPKLPSSSSVNASRPLGVFDFPWQGRFVVAAPELDGCDFRDIFFRSLVDGSSAKIGFPGDRLRRTPAPFSLLTEDGLWPFDDDMDGVDCIWSAVLGQSLLAARHGKVSNA